MTNKCSFQYADVYDVEKLVSYPGFNVDLPEGVRDVSSLCAIILLLRIQCHTDLSAGNMH